MSAAGPPQGANRPPGGQRSGAAASVGGSYKRRGRERVARLNGLSRS